MSVESMDTHMPRQQHLIDKLIRVIDESDDGEVLTNVEIIGVLEIVKLNYHIEDDD